MNVFQATVCLLFNDFAELSYNTIKEKTNIHEDQLKPALLYLCNPKVKLLNKEKNKAEFEKDEKISVNLKFTNAQLRLQLLPQLNQKKKTNEPTEEDKENEKGIKQERQAVCDAYIVKVMKTHKTVMHTELITKVMQQISMFKAEPQMIKMRIESLIERAYMKRDEKNKALYIYVP